MDHAFKREWQLVLKVRWPYATLLYTFFFFYNKKTVISLITFAEAHLHTFAAEGSYHAEPRLELGPASKQAMQRTTI